MAPVNVLTVIKNMNEQSLIVVGVFTLGSVLTVYKNMNEQSLIVGVFTLGSVLTVYKNMNEVISSWWCFYTW